MTMDVEGFGEVLKELRNRKKKSRPKVAQQLKIHPSTLEKWERGDVLPDKARVKELIDVLKLTEVERLLLLEAHAGYRILPSLHNLPTPQNPYFTGRETILAQIHDQLASGSQVALTSSPQAINGLGGIGKTQVALHYAYRFQKAYSHVLWATADSPEMLSTEFVRLARDLNLPEKDEQDQSKIVQAVQLWLREYLDWLLILDNIEDLGLVLSFIPVGHMGSVLLTTRRQVTEPIAQALELKVFSEDDGMLFLLKRAKRLAPHGSLDEVEVSEITTARVITQQLGGLPLALDQAGAYIAENRCSFSDYLDLFKKRQTTLLQRRGTVPSDHPQSVTATFSLAFEQIQQKSEAAIELLKLCSFLASDFIPLELFTQGAVHLGSALEPVVTDAFLLNQVLETLQAYSLVQRDHKRKTLSVHRLVQVVLQDELKEVERYAWAKRVITILDKVFPKVTDEDWKQCERLLPHVLACNTSVYSQEISLNLASLLFKTARYLIERVQYSMSESLFLQSLHIREDILDPEHVDVVQSLNGLAILYRIQGKYEKAELFHLRALSIREKTLDMYDSRVASSLNNLALIYVDQGRYEKAEPLYQRALHIWEQSSGPTHPDVAHALHNLAELYNARGRYEKAEPLYQRALHIWEQSSGPTHPDVIYPINGLAVTYYNQGKYEKAEPLYQRALLIGKQQLWPEHPNVALLLYGLANLFREQGRYAEAKPLYQSALHIREQALGIEHLETSEVMFDFALLLDTQRNKNEAKSLYECVLAVRKQVLGHDHPKTRDVHIRYTTLLRSMKQYEDAASFEEDQFKQESQEGERNNYQEE